MKNFTVFFIGLLFIGGLVFGQEAQTEKKPNTAVTLGFLQGGGSLVGVDFEHLVSDRISLQVGVGIIGLGAAINYHLKPSISSSMISLLYWHQGIGNTFTQSLLGPSFVFRAKKLFTASLGLGFALAQGPAWPKDKIDQPPVMLTYSIGIYLPVK